MHHLGHKCEIYLKNHCLHPVFFLFISHIISFHTSVRMNPIFDSVNLHLIDRMC